MGWTTDSREPRQYVHAVRPGRVIAACGVRIVCGGDRWPETVWAWDGPAPRCPRCSRVAYGLRPAPPV